MNTVNREGAVRKLRDAEIELRNAEAAEHLLHLETLRCEANWREAVRRAVSVGAGSSEAGAIGV